VRTAWRISTHGVSEQRFITVALPVGIRGRKIRLLHRTNLRKFIVLPRENAFFPAALKPRTGGMLI